MGKGNKSAKEKLIAIYGAECFIDKLHLRPEKERRYTGKKQYQRMKQLTYHHIKEKSKGGQATLENGAVLSLENHIWFNKQTPEKQAEMNKKFQEYKKCGVVLVEDLGLDIEIKAMPFEVPEERPKQKFNRAKVNREFRKRVEEELYEKD
jgi:hypothetical protein